MEVVVLVLVELEVVLVEPELAGVVETATDPAETVAFVAGAFAGTVAGAVVVLELVVTVFVMSVDAAAAAVKVAAFAMTFVIFAAADWEMGKSRGYMTEESLKMDEPG